MKNFKKLKVWEKVRQIAIDVYRFSDTLERQWTFTFSSQITGLHFQFHQILLKEAASEAKRTTTDF